MSQAGHIAEAKDLAASLLAGTPTLALYEATAAWKAGHTEEAAVRYREIQKWPGTAAVARADLLLGELELGRNRDADAIAALEHYRALDYGYYVNPHRAMGYPRALYMLAVAYGRQGDRAKAKERIDELLAMWKHADPDFPLLAEARALGKRLASAPSSGD